VSRFRKSLISPQLFGRTQEIEIIQHAFAAAKESIGQCLLISGDAGIGKSRLTAAITEQAEREQFTLLYGICFEEDIALPYGPWIYAIRQYLAQISPKQVEQILAQNAVEVIKLVPEFTHLLKVIPPAPELSPEAEKRRLFEAWARFLAQLSTQHPVLIVLEDLHWGDETSLELLQFCARRFSKQPFLFTGTFRQESITPQLKRFVSQMNRERLAYEMQLKPLNRHHVAEMIRAIFDIDRPIKLDFLDLIVHLTGGNPFFVEEVLKSLVESGGIYWSNGVWERRPVIELQVPRSTRDAVQQRLEGLSVEARQVVTMMAAAGKRSTFELLQALSKHEESQLIMLVKELIEAQIIVEAAPDQFAFRHELTREAVYTSLMARERKALHRMIADTVEDVFAGSLEIYESNLAMHYYQSGQWEKALNYARKAGEKAQALYAPREAFEHFNRAIDAARQLSLPLILDLYRARGLASQSLGSFDAAENDFQTCLEISRTTQCQSAEWQALLDLALLMEGRDYPQAGEYNQQALALARRLNNPALIGRTLIRLAIWYTNMYQSTEASLCVEEAFQIFEELNDSTSLAQTLNAQGNILMNAGKFRKGQEAYSQAIPLFEEAGDLQGLFDCRINMTMCSALDLYYTESPTMTLEESQQYAEGALEIARQISSQTDEVLASIRLAMILRAQGRYELALELAKNATEVADEVEHPEWSSFGWATQAENQRDLLNFDLAHKYYEHALQRVEQTGNLEIKQIIAGMLARIYLHQNALGKAEQLLISVLPEKTQPDTVNNRLVHYSYAWLAFNQNQPQKTIEILDQIQHNIQEIAGSEANPSPVLLKLRAEALLKLGQVGDALKIFRQARDAAEKNGALTLLWRIHHSLARLHQSENPEQSEQEYKKARAIIDRIAISVPDEKVRNNFLREAESLFPPAKTSVVFSQETEQAEEGPLTAREMEVVTLIKAGKSNQEIADELVLSKRTVEKHISNILSKLMLQTRAQIIVWGLQDKSFRNT
jgi:predicted ATPase/DNA-binding CsgD family transcriptional regulator